MTESRLLDGSGAPALMASGAAMRLNVGALLNNDNCQIAADSDLAIVSLGDIAIEGSQLSSGRDMLVAGKGRVDIVNTTDSSSLATSARAKGYRGSDELHTETVNGSRLQAEGNVTVHCWGHIAGVRSYLLPFIAAPDCRRDWLNLLKMLAYVCA